MTKMFRLQGATAAILVASLTNMAQAQQAPAPAATTIEVPAMNCDKPADTGPGLDPTPAQSKRFQKSVDTYKSCVDVYAHEMARLANDHAAAAKKFADASTAAVDNYNAFIGEVRKRAE